MKRLVCVGCGFAEDLNNPSGNIHTVQLVDMSSTFDVTGRPDKTIEEDLCKSCRAKLRREFFGFVEAELLEMPLMKAGA